MITSAHIARFRGIRELAISGLGRVNLIIGRNDCGKTGLLEALQLGDAGRDAAVHLYVIQKHRLRREVPPLDFDQFWRPLFFDLDAALGCSIMVSDDRAGPRTLEVREGPALDRTILEGEAGESLDLENPIGRPAWSLALDIRTGQEHLQHSIVAAAGRLRLPPGVLGSGTPWIDARTSLGTSEVRFISELKQAGRDGELVALLREVDARLSGIELLAPGGRTAEPYVRLDNGTPLLPASVMGDGFQRCLEIGVAVAAAGRLTVFVDEIENGLHHLSLEPVWRWIASTASRRGLQVFATTHSEECIQAACRAFAAQGDDGLRVIRLDRTEGGTRAVVYDRALLETAARTDTEIRG